MVRTRLNIGCRYSTPVLERPLHPTRSQFKPQPSQTQAPVTPRDRAGAPRRWRLNNKLVLATRSQRVAIFLKPLTPPLDRSDLLLDMLHLAAAGAALVLPVGLVEPVEITRQPLVALGQRLRQLRFGEVPLPAVHCLDPCTVNRHQLASEQLQFAA